MSESFRTPWISDVVDLIDRPETNRIVCHGKEFVRVVRCQNCEYYNGDQQYCSNDVFAKADGYCHYGKKKENETD